MPKRRKPLPPSTLSEQIRQAVAAYPHSRNRLAREVGTSASTLSLFMSGKRGLRLPVLDALAERLGLRVTTGQANTR